MNISFLFAWYDIWIGAFWDRNVQWLYILPVPMCGIILKFKPWRYKVMKIPTRNGNLYCVLGPDGVQIKDPYGSSRAAYLAMWQYYKTYSY